MLPAFDVVQHQHCACARRQLRDHGFEVNADIQKKIEAGEAFGATKKQLLWKVELPAALPSIMAGLTQCIMLSLSMVVIAALIGASGLGKPVVRGLNSLNIPLGIEAGLAIVILAIILDRMCRVSTGAKS